LPSDESKWTNSFYVLLNDDANTIKTQIVIEKILAKDVLNVPVAALGIHQPLSVSTLLAMDDEKKNKKADSVKEDARAKLGRYLLITYPEGVDLSAIFDAFKNDPDIAYFGINESIVPAMSAGSGGSQTQAITSTITEDKFWGFNKVRASFAHSYEYGHAYIGVADLGLNPNHLEFIDYIGNTWKGGNYHPATAFNLGGTVGTNGTYANPYTGLAIFGEADSYHLKALPGDTNCDGGDANNTNEIWSVGHGSHVTGIIAANVTNNTGVKGVCRHCPLGVAQVAYPDGCTSGSHPDGSIYEAYVNAQIAQFMAGIGSLIDVGAQVINMSAGDPSSSFSSTFCSSNASSPVCLVIEYSQDRDVIFVASAGNGRKSKLDFPAADGRVLGVSGLENVNGGQFWTGGLINGDPFGSNYGTSSSNGPTFSAPAKDVYSTMYKGKQYNLVYGCDDRTDGITDDYGYCTGTSMAAPFVAGVAGLVKSVNPLAPNSDVRQVLIDSTGQSGYSNQLGYGTPRADYAVKAALGKSGGVQVVNRTVPLFSMYSSVAGDIAQTTKPQLAAAYHLNLDWGYIPFTAEAIVNGFTFSESPDNPTLPAARADLFILSTHRTPPTGRTTTPLYRLRWVGAYGGNPNDADWALVLESEISGSLSFRAVGYEMDGIEGYVYTTCTPEPSCIPVGAVIVYRAYHPQRDDHAVFPASKLSYMQSIGYTDGLKKLGYAYPNQDSDSDGVINGMEYILGTNVSLTDSDCDGQTDGYEYPLTRSPRSDPEIGSC
jgi:subtilisin family serine protease